MLARRPLFINQLSSETGISLARLTGLDGFARAILVGVLPLIALEAFGNKETIATVYFASAIFTLIITMNLALLETLLQRRWLVTLGAIFLAVSVGFFYTTNALLFTVGIGLRSAGATIFSVCISLYVMDYIGKAELVRTESRRMLYTGAAWLIGPVAGVWLFEHSHPLVVFSIAVLAAIAMLAYFWRLRLGDDVVIRSARSQLKSPLRVIVRYVSQRRLCIAYGIVLSRACFWAMLFVYGPIYVVEAGLPAWIGGILLSGVSGLLFLSPVIQRMANRFGTRQMLMGGSILIGVSMIALGMLGAPQPIGLLFLVTGSCGGAVMDVLGNIPFMRSVRPSERTDMTMVFTTWREGSSLLTQALVFLTLLVAPFWVFYILLGVMQLGAAVWTSYLPRRL